MDYPISAGTSASTIQSTINSAVRGDTITFAAGATFDTTGFTLPVKSGTNDGTDANSVILRSSSMASLPTGRVAPSNASLMACIRTTTTSPIFTANSGAGGYKFIGLEFSTYKVSPPANYVVNLFFDFTLMGAYVTFDRCFIHPQEYPNTTAPYNTTARFCFAINGDHVTITNNYIPAFYGLYYGTSTGATPIDSVVLSVGQGSYITFQNNYCEAWYNPIFLGGSDTSPTSTATLTSPTLTSATLSNVTGLHVGDLIAIELPTDNINTTLNGSLSNVATTITVVSTANFDSSGYLVIDFGLGSQEHVSYTGKTSTTFTGCVRGADGSSPVSHSSGAAVTEGYCKRGAGYQCWGNGIVQSIVGNNITFTALVGTNYTGFKSINIPASVVPNSPGQAAWAGKTINNITIKQNHIHLPTTFCQWVQTNNGNHPKGYMEIKSLEDSLVEGNLCDGYFSTLAFNTVNQNGGSPWLKLNNVTIKNNWIKGTRSLCFLIFDEQYYMATNGGNVSLLNNLATDPDSAVVAGDIPAFISGGAGGNNITIQHNTFYTGDNYTQKLLAWSLLLSPRNQTAGVTFKDNIVSPGNYGFNCDTGGTAGCWSPLTEDQNLFVLNVNPPNQNPVTDQGFSNSLTAANTAAVKWANPGGSALDDWRLLSSSPGHGTATDSTDIGVDITALRTALGPDTLADIGDSGGGSSPTGQKLIALCT